MNSRKYLHVRTTFQLGTSGFFFKKENNILRGSETPFCPLDQVSNLT